MLSGNSHEAVQIHVILNMTLAVNAKVIFQANGTLTVCHDLDTLVLKDVLKTHNYEWQVLEVVMFRQNGEHLEKAWLIAQDDIVGTGFAVHLMNTAEWANYWMISLTIST